MTDNKRKDKADGKRVALKQDYEREYLIDRLDEASGKYSLAEAYLAMARTALRESARGLRAANRRLRAGFPKKSKRGRS